MLNMQTKNTNGRTILMNIIQQVMEIITKSYGENLEKALRGSIHFSDMTIKLEEDFRRAAALVAKEVLEYVNDEIKESKGRKKEWYVERNNDEKTISTVLGPITYKRTYYVHKQTGAYAYLSDDQVGITPHERIDLGLKSKILEHASSMSYQRTVDLIAHSGITSKTSVMNVVKESEPIPNDAAALPNRKEETPSILYIEADEDHVALQSGKSTISKIVYVHEGRKPLSKGRHQLMHKRYFTAQGDNEALWLDVANYLDQVYDMDKVETVYLSGDGASWIKEGAKWIVKSKYVLDRFHLSKYIRMATAHMDYAREPLTKYIRKGMKKAVFDLFKVIIKNTESESKKKSVRMAMTYIRNNWEGIQRQKAKGYVGCSAEGHVSHVLSDRLSSRPMGWSKKGLLHMSSMRVFKHNGGNFYEQLLRGHNEIMTEARITKLDNRVLNQARQVSGGVVPNVSFYLQGKKTGTSVVLKSFRGL